MRERIIIRCSHCGQLILGLLPTMRSEPKYPGKIETLVVKEEVLKLGQKPCPNSPDGQHTPAFN